MSASCHHGRSPRRGVVLAPFDRQARVMRFWTSFELVGPAVKVAKRCEGPNRWVCYVRAISRFSRRRPTRPWMRVEGLVEVKARESW